MIESLCANLNTAPVGFILGFTACAWSVRALARGEVAPSPVPDLAAHGARMRIRTAYSRTPARCTETSWAN